MTQLHPYSRFLPTTSPATGVVACGSVEFIYDEIGIDPDFDANLQEYLADDPDRDLDGFFYSPERELIGDWTQDQDTGEYEPTPGLPKRGYAAIAHWDSQTIQVVASKWVTLGHYCSPCYPGQVDLDTAGEYLGYDLPADLYGVHRRNSNPIQAYTPEEAN